MLLIFTASHCLWYLYITNSLIALYAAPQLLLQTLQFWEQMQNQALLLPSFLKTAHPEVFAVLALALQRQRQRLQDLFKWEV